MSAFLALNQRSGIEVRPLLDLKQVASPSAAVLISGPIHYWL